MTNSSLTRYVLQIDLLERDGSLDDAAAIDLLRSEFVLALNASHFSGLGVEDIAVDVRSRECPQDDVARYSVVLELEERTPHMTDEQAAELVSREFQRALNGGHFIRVSAEDFPARLVAREVAAPVGG